MNVTKNDIDLENKLDNMCGCEISDDLYKLIANNKPLMEKITDEIWRLLQTDRWSECGEDEDELYDADHLYMAAICNIMYETVIQTQGGYGMIYTIDEFINDLGTKTIKAKTIQPGEPFEQKLHTLDQDEFLKIKRSQDVKGNVDDTTYLITDVGRLIQIINMETKKSTSIANSYDLFQHSFMKGLPSPFEPTN